jgi:hypothetical protein
MSKNQKPARYAALGARLKFLREQWQQSITDVCNTLEINEQQLREFEDGVHAPSPELLDMLISHFLLTEDQAQDLRDLLDDQADQDGSQASIEEMLNRQLVMLLPQDNSNRVAYTDSMQVTVNDNGVTLQFMQQQTGNVQPITVSKLGMSKDHAQKIITILSDALQHHGKKD